MINLELRYTVNSSDYTFKKVNNGIPFDFSYKNARNNAIYNFNYDIRETIIKFKPRKQIIFLSKVDDEIYITDKCKKLKCTSTIKQININKNSKELARNSKKEINTYNDSKMLYRKNIKENNLCNNPKILYRKHLKDIGKFKLPKMIYRENLKYILIKDIKSYYYKDNFKDINKAKQYHDLNYINCKDIYNIDTLKKLERYNFKNMSLSNFEVLERINHEINKTKTINLNKKTRGIFKNDPKYLNKNINGIVKNTPRYLDKPYHNISIPPIRRYLHKNDTEININNNIFNYLELSKRWWWCETSWLQDKLAVPMQDYSYDKKYNYDYFCEYLRYSTHPIPWGNNWGITYHTENTVTVEIMLDIVNIITMLWHTNWTSWNAVTGKEAIQILMEVLHEWFTLDTNEANEDYYRTYRWIRWEAEKVYFKARKDIQENGAKYIGILVANLIDYMKQHHFDIVPIQQNIMHMASIRIDNQQGNLMEDVDKEKGNRFYYLETQQG